MKSKWVRCLWHAHHSRLFATAESSKRLTIPGVGVGDTWIKHTLLITGRRKKHSLKAPLPHGHADFMRLLTDGRDAAVAHAGFLVVTGGRSHITEFAQ